MSSSHHHFTRAAMLLLGAALFACGGDAPVAPPPVDELAPGRYDLHSVGGQALPATIFAGVIEHDSAPPFHLRLEIPEGRLEILPNDRYRQQLTVVAYIDGQPDIIGPAYWLDLGGIQPHAQGYRFTSHYIQNVEFSAGYSGNALQTAQDILRHFHGQSAITHLRFER